MCIFKQWGIIDFHKIWSACRPLILRNNIHCLTHENVFSILLGYVDEHVIEFFECVIVPIATEYVWHLFIYFVVHMHEHTHLSNMHHHQWTSHTTREALHHLPPCTPIVHSNCRRNRLHDSLSIHRWYEEGDYSLAKIHSMVHPINFDSNWGKRYSHSSSVNMGGREVPSYVISVQS